MLPSESINIDFCRDLEIRLRQISRIDDFPFALKQKDRYCIPANVQAVSNYLKPDIRITQEEIFQNYQNRGGTLDNIGLESIKREVLDRAHEFSWSRSEYLGSGHFPDFDSFVARVKASINTSLPHIISTKLPITVTQSSGQVIHTWSPWHMLTVVGYDEQDLEVYNSEPIYGLANRSRIGTAQLREWLRIVNRGAETTDSLVISVKPTSRS